MRKGLTFALMMVLVLAMAAPALAFTQGTFRLGARSAFDTMTISSDPGGDIDVDTIALEAGYFVVDNVEVCLAYSDMSFDSQSYTTTRILGKYFIPVQENSAFVGGGYADISFFDADGDAFFITGGFALQVKEYFSIDFALLLGQGDIEGDDIDITDLSVTYSLYF